MLSKEKLVDWGFTVGGFVSSLYLQAINKESILVAGLCLVAFLLVEVFSALFRHNSFSIAAIAKSPYYRALFMFFFGGLCVCAYTSLKSLKVRQKDKQEVVIRRELYAKALAAESLCRIVLDRAELENEVPSTEWCDSMGVPQSEPLAEYIYSEYAFARQDFESAREYLTKASESLPIAKARYAYLVYFGFADIPDPKEGLRLMMEAAEDEVSFAQKFLAGYYATNKEFASADYWTNRLFNADCDGIDIYLDNDLLYKPTNDFIRERCHRHIDGVLHDMNENRWGLFSRMLALYMDSNKPSYAMDLCDSYFSIWDYEEDKDALSNDFKYEILLRSGNESQARKYKGKGLLKKGNQWGDLEESLKYNTTRTYNHSFRIKKDQS
jgi:hypothetical protein